MKYFNFLDSKDVVVVVVKRVFIEEKWMGEERGWEVG